MTTPTEDIKLYYCQPVYWRDELKMPKIFRLIIGWITLIAFTMSFLSLPFLFVIPFIFRYTPVFSTCYCLAAVISMLLPMTEWPWARKIGQLWYEIFNFSCNLSPAKLLEVVDKGLSVDQFIIGMHPHGIIPIQAILWAAYCDQYLGPLYGFGAAADVVMYLPFLRNIMGWLSAGSASYKVLLKGLQTGIVPMVNRVAGRKPRHLFILPGGIAEVFTSQPGKHMIVFKNRRGLIKLSIETGAKLLPCYVFGGTDFFYNLMTYSDVFATISRKLRMSITLFFGCFGLPIPFTPRVTLIIGEPINYPIQWDKTASPDSIPVEAIEALHHQLTESLQIMFDKYKDIAGYKDAVLEIL